METIVFNCKSVIYYFWEYIENIQSVITFLRCYKYEFVSVYAIDLIKHKWPFVYDTASDGFLGFKILQFNC